MTEIVEKLLCKLKTLNLNPSTDKKERKRKKMKLTI
jgi:hypothetical protein